MNKYLVVIAALLAVAAFVHADEDGYPDEPEGFGYNNEPVVIAPNTQYYVRWLGYAGGNYAIWVPTNASSLTVTVTRQANDNLNCSNNHDAYYNAKWNSYPCSGSYDYPGWNTNCENIYTTNILGGLYGSTGSSSLIDTLTLSASGSSSSFGVRYNRVQDASGSDFLPGTWFYLSGYLDLAGDCTGTLNVTFTYCNGNGVAAESETSVDSICVPTYNVTSANYTRVSTNTTDFVDYYRVTVPVNASGIWVTLTSDDSDYNLYGRLGSGTQSTSFYYYDYDFSGSTQDLWFPNVPAGQFIVSVDSDSASFYNYNITIQTYTCPNGFGSDEDGNCVHPYKVVSTNELVTSPAETVTVAAYNISGMDECAWTFLSYSVPAHTYAYVNVTATKATGASSTIYVRQGAWPTNSFYDDFSTVTTTWNFTPEDFYTETSVTYYFGVCNTDTAAGASWTLAGTYQEVDPDDDNAATSAVASVAMILALIALLF